MSALPHLVGFWQTADQPFAVKNGNSQKTSSLRPPSAFGEEGATSEEQRLIQRVLAGDSEAQAHLFKTYTPRLYRIAFKVLHNKEDAEDAVQDGWCRAYLKLHTFAGRSSLSTWLTRVVINSALIIRRKNKHPVQQMPYEVFDGQNVRDSLIDDQATPEQACRNAEMNDLLVRQIALLPSICRVALLLFDLQGFTTAESTKMLGINTSALKSRVLRARRRLAQNIAHLDHARRHRTSVRRDGYGANYSTGLTENDVRKQ